MYLGDINIRFLWPSKKISLFQNMILIVKVNNEWLRDLKAILINQTINVNKHQGLVVRKPINAL